VALFPVSERAGRLLDRRDETADAMGNASDRATDSSSISGTLRFPLRVLLREDASQEMSGKFRVGRDVFTLTSCLFAPWRIDPC
jgi:hypothetical protein